MVWNDWGNYSFILPSGIEIYMSGYSEELRMEDEPIITIETEEGKVVTTYQMGGYEKDHIVLWEKIDNESIIDEIIYYLENKLYLKEEK